MKRVHAHWPGSTLHTRPGRHRTSINRAAWIRNSTSSTNIIQHMFAITSWPTSYWYFGSKSASLVKGALKRPQQQTSEGTVSVLTRSRAAHARDSARGPRLLEHCVRHCNCFEGRTAPSHDVSSALSWPCTTVSAYPRHILRGEHTPATLTGDTTPISG